MYNLKKLLLTLLIFVISISFTKNEQSFALNTTIIGSIGDLDNSGDSNDEDAIVQAASVCWDARITTDRPFNLTVNGADLTGGTLGTGGTTAVDASNTPTDGLINIDNSNRVWFIDTSPLDNSEYDPDPSSQWRFLNGPGSSDLLSVVIHEIGHANGWIDGPNCGLVGSNPDYEALYNPAPPFVAGPLCTSPFPIAGQPQLPGCVNLEWLPDFDVSLRGDGLGGSGSSVCNELSHPGVSGDLMFGFLSGGTRETHSQIDVDMFNHAYEDTVNLPLDIDAGMDITQECDATGGSNVTLDGTGSSDPEGDALTFAWSCENVALNSPNTENPDGFFPLGTTACRLDATDLVECPPDADLVEVTIEDTTDPDITCPSSITVECSETGGTPSTDPAINAFLNGATANDICDDDLPITNDNDGFFELGDTTVAFEAVDDSGNGASCSEIVTVEDTTPPEITDVTATPDTLWPPNHKFKEITVDVTVTDICDSTPSCSISNVESNEPINGTGDGNTSPDWEITGDFTVNLRSERSGNGEGRVYTITVECLDDSGVSSEGIVEVIVPHDQRKK